MERIIDYGANKFGGGILDGASAIKRLPSVIKGHVELPAVLVFSAFGKNTRLLRNLVQARIDNDREKSSKLLLEFTDFHIKISHELLGDEGRCLFSAIKDAIEGIERGLEFLNSPPSEQVVKFVCDQVLPHGELLASRIIHIFLKKSGMENVLIDSTNLINTDSNFSEANVNRKLTQENIETLLVPEFSNCNLIVTQGFIGYMNSSYINTRNDSFKILTTLGDNSSDYSAVLLAKRAVLWKRIVGGVPSHLSYLECKKLLENELKGLIHPKTIDEAMEKKIPIYVKDYNYPDNPGIIIQ